MATHWAKGPNGVAYPWEVPGPGLDEHEWERRVERGDLVPCDPPAAEKPKPARPAARSRAKKTEE